MNLNGLFLWYDLVWQQLRKNVASIYDTKKLSGRVIENIYKQYLVYFPVYGKPLIVSRSGLAVKWSNNTYILAKKISDVLNIPVIVILNYLLVVYDLTQKGIIDYKYFDPLSAKTGELSKKQLDPGFFDLAVKQSKNIFTPIAAIAISAGVIYLVYTFKKR